ncbi:MAG: lipid A export permease/ATP-binding protein MsbA [Gammaproteobacteria bacterium]|nr:lipid A export permease/ATP-binding protein MsbA [Gammaproteobacteria bacterium]
MSSSQKTWPIYKRLLGTARKYWPLAAIGIIGTIFQSSFDALFSWLIKVVIDKGFVEHNALFIKWFPLAFVAIFLCRGSSNFASTFCLSKVARSVVMDLRRRLFTKFLTLPAKFYDQNSPGHLLSTVIYNVEQVANATATASIKALRDGWFLVGLIIVMFSLNWRVALIIGAAGPFLALLLRWTSRKLRRHSTNVQQSIGDVTHIADEGIQGHKVIRIFGGQKYENTKFRKATFENRRQEMKVVITNNLGTILTQLLIAVPLAVTVYIATLPSMHMTAGSFAALFATMAMMLTPLRRLTNLNGDIQRGVAGADSIFKVLDEPEENDLGARQLSHAQGQVEYRQVDFQYPNTQQKVLQQFNLKIKAGQTVALVGRSGAGKSTLVNLLPRFYEVSQGEILLDGVDTRSYQLKDLRAQFALVSQQTTLFDDTVANNIAYGVAETTDRNKIIAAARAANALEFIEALPEGFDTVIGDDGVLLSGGQRQRIAIARAILKDAPILILDEATSSLDTKSERLIQSALENLMRNRTTLVIAHRLSTIESADRILVLQEGRLVEEGSHAELIAVNGVYAELHRLQFSEQPEAVSA